MLVYCCFVGLAFVVVLLVRCEAVWVCCDVDVLLLCCCVVELFCCVVVRLLC